MQVVAGLKRYHDIESIEETVPIEVAYPPGSALAGQVFRCSQQLYDIQGAKLPISIGLAGLSMTPLMKNPDAQTREGIYLAYREYQRAVLESRYKFIEYVQVTQKGAKVSTRLTQPQRCRNAVEDRFSTCQFMTQESILNSSSDFTFREF